MKDLQIDATALPGKAFDCTFEMPEQHLRHAACPEPRHDRVAAELTGQP